MLRAAFAKAIVRKSHSARVVIFCENYFILSLSSIQLAMPKLRKTIHHQITHWLKFIIQISLNYPYTGSKI